MDRATRPWGTSWDAAESGAASSELGLPPLRCHRLEWCQVYHVRHARRWRLIDNYQPRREPCYEVPANAKPL